MDSDCLSGSLQFRFHSTREPYDTFEPRVGRFSRLPHEETPPGHPTESLSSVPLDPST